MTDKPLSQRMLEAADTITELNARYQYGPEYSGWGPAALRKEAPHVEAEERDAAEREAQVQALEHDLRGLTISGLSRGEAFTVCARKLVESGWRKGDPA